MKSEGEFEKRGLRRGHEVREITYKKNYEL